jgi:ABC-type multidrug transport system permease subunit
LANLVAEPDDRTKTQREWADWAAHGYRKLYQPRSMLWFGGVFFVLFAVALLVVFWLAGSGRWP